MLLNEPVAPNIPLNEVVRDFTFDSAPTNDETAVALVVQDTKRCEAFMTSRLWMSEWRIAKSLYEAPVQTKNWRDTVVSRAANSFPLVAQHVRAIHDQAMPALFSDTPPFSIDPNEGTPWQVARAWSGVLKYQVKQANFKQEISLIVKDAEVFGTGIGQWGWESREKKRKIYERATQPKRIQPLVPGGKTVIEDTEESDALNEVLETQYIKQPFFHRVEINHLLVDPGLRDPDVRKATFVVHRTFPTIRQLNDLRDYEDWDIPSEAELRKLAEPPVETPASSPLETEGTSYPAQGHRTLPRYIDSTEDPLDHKLECLVRWSETSTIAVLQRKKCIRRGMNTFGVIPFVSCYWDDIPGCFYGFGIPRRIGGIQTHIQGLRNTRLDDIHLSLMNMWMVKKGTEIAAQPIKAYPGAVFKVDDVKTSMIPVPKQPILNDAYREEDVLVGDAEKTTGANAMLVQGAKGGGGATGMRTATGAGAVAGASSSRIQGFVDVVAEQVFLPTLSAFIEMSRHQLDPKVMRKVIGKTLWDALNESYDGKDLLVDMVNNEDLEVSILAGANIASKKAMAATLPLLMQMASTPQFAQGLQSAGLKFNWLEFGRRLEWSTGWQASDEMFIPLTQQDQQNMMQSNPKVIDAKATQARLAQMHGDKKELSAQEHAQDVDLVQQKADAEGLAKAGQEVLVKSLERAQVHEEQPELANADQGF